MGHLNRARAAAARRRTGGGSRALLAWPPLPCPGHKACASGMSYLSREVGVTLPRAESCQRIGRRQAREAGWVHQALLGRTPSPLWLFKKLVFSVSRRCSPERGSWRLAAKRRDLALLVVVCVCGEGCCSVPRALSLPLPPSRAGKPLAASLPRALGDSRAIQAPGGKAAAGPTARAGWDARKEYSAAASPAALSSVSSWCPAVRSPRLTSGSGWRGALPSGLAA